MGDHLTSYRQRGYAVIEKGLTADALAMLRTTVNALLAEPDPQDPPFHDIERGEDRRFLRHRHRDVAALEAFLLSGQVAALAKSFVGPTACLFNEQFVVKGPRTGASFAWHQDSAYVGFDHRPYVTLWMAIDDATLENGCISVLPRPPGGVVPHEWDAEGKELVGHDPADPGVPVPCPAGTIVAFASTTLHRSGANTTDARRRAFICQYSPEPIVDPATGALRNFATPLA